ncbi:sulfatase [uncultured Gimesia sp.]|uniref:sulfatase n=1 Tax=uncultured Gimesia sp. TaxID=1678688 RepID=UPI0030D6F5B3|tara:strand:+ start:28852 stop:30189 length:1338 start_codon:yes stop_codon:yes gene_type:complete
MKSLIIAVFCFVFLPVLAVAEEKSNKPNIVLIMADDLGYGDLSCYGSKNCDTPQLDRLASQGMKFTDFHSSGTVCSPTRAGLLTGRYQQRAGIDGVVYANPKKNRHHGLQKNEITLAQCLQSAGYRTGMFGKWHLGYQRQYNPTFRGFQRFVGYVSGNVDYFAHLDGTGVFDWWHDAELNRDEQGYVTHLITDHAVDFIRQQKDQPFFVYIAHEAVHYPYQGPKDKPMRKEGVGDINSAKRQDITNAYREMNTEMDRGIGKVVAVLNELKLTDNTLIIFLSDNGANKKGSNGKLRGFKGNVWEGGHRVPAIACWPGRITAGSVCEETVISIDLMPTILELAQATLPDDHQLDGVSLVHLLKEQQKLKPRSVFWDYNGRSAVRQGPWKLVLNQNHKAPVELFNLQDDLAESNNLAVKNPERVQQMQAAFADWKKEVTQTATLQPTK